jgi:hypothetical protein
LKVERARVREEQSMRDGSTEISKSTNKVSVVEPSRSSNKLTKDMKNMRDVITTDTKVDKAANKMPIASRMSKGFTISSPQVNT